jgi:hypothetical protein
MLLRLAPCLIRSSPGDGVHKPPSPFCKAESKRYMLRPYAYGTVGSRVTCRSGARKPVRMEVGRRQGRNALHRSARSRRAARRDLNWLAGRFGASTCRDEHSFATIYAGCYELPRFRNLEARRSRHGCQYGRRSRCSVALRTNIATRSFYFSVSRWEARRRLSAKWHGVHAQRSAARYAHIGCGDSQQLRSHPGNANCSVHGSPRVRSQSTRWSIAATHTKAARARCSEQAAFIAAELCGVEWSTVADGCAHEQACSSLVRSRGPFSFELVGHLVQQRDVCATAPKRRAES